MGGGMRSVLIGLAVAASLATSPIGANAQETEGAGSFVENLQEIDSPTVCDTVGWSVMPGEFANNTIDYKREAACHHGVAGSLVVACIEPYAYMEPEFEGGPPPGTAYIFCTVGVMSHEAGLLVVDP